MKYGDLVVLIRYNGYDHALQKQFYFAFIANGTRSEFIFEGEVGLYYGDLPTGQMLILFGEKKVSIEDERDLKKIL